MTDAATALPKDPSDTRTTVLVEVESGMTMRMELLDGRPVITSLGAAGLPAPVIPRTNAVGPVEISLAGAAIPRGQRNIGHGTTLAMTYVSHDVHPTADGPEVVLVQRIEDSSIRLTTHLKFYDDLPSLRTWSVVDNLGDTTTTLLYVSSFSTTALVDPGATALDAVLGTPLSTFCAEYRWRFASLRAEGLVDAGLNPDLGVSSTSRVVVQSGGTQPTIESLPMGSLQSDTVTWLWNIEHNGAWRWEIGDYRGGAYLSVSGPTADHAWQHELSPGRSFSTVPVTLTAGRGPADALFGDLTTLRRRLADPEPAGSLVIFNDFQRCLMADPDEEKILPLIGLAARAGAEVFCIDAGWYAEDGEWWETVGEWVESRRRFPRGLTTVMDRIRAEGMIPGLWIEPEVIGVKSPVMSALPADAFFWHANRLVDGGGRHLLDFTSPAAVSYVDGVVDRLVADYGIGYLKIDYNVNGGSGSDADGGARGAHLLRHNQALLDWVRRLRSRHPELIVENCSSGGARVDDASMRHFSIMSTSDQDDYLRLAPISVNGATAAVPEKVGVWTIPDSSRPMNEAVFALVNSMLVRPQLSGPIAELTAREFGLVVEAVQVYKRIRDDLRGGTPLWPTGLAEWDDEWLTFAMNCGTHAYLAVWRRAGDTFALDIALSFAGHRVQDVRRVFPAADSSTVATWDPNRDVLHVDLPTPISAALFEVDLTSAARG